MFVTVYISVCLCTLFVHFCFTCKNSNSKNEFILCQRFCFRLSRSLRNVCFYQLQWNEDSEVLKTADLPLLSSSSPIIALSIFNIHWDIFHFQLLTAQASLMSTWKERRCARGLVTFHLQTPCSLEPLVLLSRTIHRDIFYSLEQILLGILEQSTIIFYLYCNHRNLWRRQQVLKL